MNRSMATIATGVVETLSVVPWLTRSTVYYGDPNVQHRLALEVAMPTYVASL
jgi:hypothetical protein